MFVEKVPGKANKSQSNYYYSNFFVLPSKLALSEKKHVCQRIILQSQLFLWAFFEVAHTHYYNPSIFSKFAERFLLTSSSSFLFDSAFSKMPSVSRRFSASLSCSLSGAVGNGKFTTCKIKQKILAFMCQGLAACDVITSRLSSSPSSRLYCVCQKRDLMR